MAVKALSAYLEDLMGDDLVPGIIVAVQTFGDRINFHPAGRPDGRRLAALMETRYRLHECGRGERGT
jgi:hypothetical protein